MEDWKDNFAKSVDLINGTSFYESRKEKERKILRERKEYRKELAIVEAQCAHLRMHPSRGRKLAIAKQIRRGRHRSVEALRGQIMNYYLNDKP